MARVHPATARSVDRCPQSSRSSAAATVGNPVRATTARHANSQFADERICIEWVSARWSEQPGQPIAIPRSLIQTLVGVAAELVHERNWSLAGGSRTSLPESRCAGEGSDVMQGGLSGA